MCSSDLFPSHDTRHMVGDSMVGMTEGLVEIMTEALMEDMIIVEGALMAVLMAAFLILSRNNLCIFVIISLSCDPSFLNPYFLQIYSYLCGDTVPVKNTA